MSLIGVSLYHSVTLERYAGDSAYGPTYEAPEELDCYFEINRRLIRDSNGDQVVSSAKMYIDAGIDLPPPNSKVTFNGDEYIVMKSDPKNDLLAGGRNHTEVSLQ